MDSHATYIVFLAPLFAPLPSSHFEHHFLLGSATTVKSPDLETSWIHRVMDLVDDDNDGSITMEETQDVSEEKG